MSRTPFALVAIVSLGCAACARAGTLDDVDARGGADAAAAGDDAAGADAAGDDAVAPDAALVDAAPVDAAPVDAAPVDAAPGDAAPGDAAPVDAAPVDAMCTPTWHDILGNGGFDNQIAPWTQTTTIIRPAADMPFAPHAGTHAAEFGAGNNANDVLVQTVTIPATATGLRVRGYQCFVTEDFTGAVDTFTTTLETPAGGVLETLVAADNEDAAPICLWTSFTWTAASAHPGETVVLRMRGRTNLIFLTRFVVDTLALEWLGCP